MYNLKCEIASSLKSIKTHLDHEVLMKRHTSSSDRATEVRQVKKVEIHASSPLNTSILVFLCFVFFLTSLVQVGINPLIPLSVSDPVYPLSYARLLNNMKNKTSINPDFGIMIASMLGFPLASRSSPSGTSLSIPLHFAARQISIIRTVLEKKNRDGHIIQQHMASDFKQK